MNRVSVTTKVPKEETVGLVLSPDQIIPFDKDPRQSPNSEYARIKASIQAQGLDQPLVVTRQPGAEQYLIAAGGNTRLKILRELFQQTGDPRFARIPCVLKPWRGESEVMLAHLRENDLRGGLTFLDKARAVCEVRNLFESEQGQVTLTQGALVSLLREKGYALSQASLSQMEYAVEVLAARLPTALREGLAHREVIQIRTFESAARALWNDRVTVESTESFDEIFTALCRRYDGPDWDFLSLRQAFEAEIADRLNQTVHAVRLALDARLSGVVEVALPRRDEDDEWPAPVAPKARPQSARGEQSAPRPSALLPNPQAGTDVSGGGKESPTHEEALAMPSAPAPIRIGAPTESKSDDWVETQGLVLRCAPRSDIPALRAELAALAMALATRHGMGPLIVTRAEAGTGYLVVDVPEPVLLEQFDEAGLAQVSMIWWQLMAFAEMSVAPVAHLLPHLSPSSVLYRALREQDAGLLFNAVWTLDPGQIGFRLWRTVGDADWSDLLAMMSHYRALHRAAERLKVTLWHTSP